MLELGAHAYKSLTSFESPVDQIMMLYKLYAIYCLLLFGLQINLSI